MPLSLSFHVCLVSVFTCLSLSSHVCLCGCGCVCVCCCVWLCVLLWCVSFFFSCTEKRSRVFVQNASVCTFKTLPCVRSKRSRVYVQNARGHIGHGVLNVHTGAFSTYTWKRFERTHGSVSLFSSRVSLLSCLPLSLLFSCLSSLLIRLSISLSLSLLVSLCLLSAPLSFFLSLSFSSLSITMTMIARPVRSLCTHSPILPDRQSAWTLAQSLSGEHVRIMQETFVYVFLSKPRATWNEVFLYLCWKEKCAWCGVCVCACVLCIEI